MMIIWKRHEPTLSWADHVCGIVKVISSEGSRGSLLFIFKFCCCIASKKLRVEKGERLWFVCDPSSPHSDP